MTPRPTVAPLNDKKTITGVIRAAMARFATNENPEKILNSVRHELKSVGVNLSDTRDMERAKSCLYNLRTQIKKKTGSTPIIKVVDRLPLPTAPAPLVSSPGDECLSLLRQATSVQKGNDDTFSLLAKLLARFKTTDEAVEAVRLAARLTESQGSLSALFRERSASVRVPQEAAG